MMSKISAQNQFVSSTFVMKIPYFTTLNIIFNVTYCLELRNVMYLSYTPHIILINVESVVWTFNNFT